LKKLCLLLVLLTGCFWRSGDAPRQDLEAGQTVRKARIYLISIEGKQAGPKVGCGDTAVPVEVDLPLDSPALAGSLDALLEEGRRHEPAGLYNALAGSPLKVQRIDLAGGSARIDLTGYLEIGGECDSPRVLEQLTRTATQFSDVKSVELFLDGKPLGELLSGKG
jgi:Sporulation and spore germination